MKRGRAASARAISTRRRSPPGEALASGAAQVLDPERLHQLQSLLLAALSIKVAAKLQDREKVPFHRKLSKDGRLLRQVAESEPRAGVHRTVVRSIRSR